MTGQGKNRIAVIDYDAGNIKSVIQALHLVGQNVEVSLTSDEKEIRSADHIILPGVGNFGDAMKRLDQTGLSEVIREEIRAGKPFLGICLGLQLLFDESEESPGIKGLSVLRGKIRRLPEGDGRKVPQIGWNRLSFPNRSRLFDEEVFWHDPGIGEPYAYFVHSYYLEAEDPSVVAATCEYGVTVHAAVESGNLYACQFHPEKSDRFGLTILHHFVNHL